MIVAQRLSRHFGRFIAVDAIDFAIESGQVVGFLGPNGAGKSTTIRMIAGYLPPTAGRVEVDGCDAMTEWRALRRRIGYLPETSPLYTEMRISEFLNFRARLFGIPRRERRRAIDLALGRCGLEDARRRPIDQLSRGYRQRVGLAAALLHEPPVLILDEPTAGLDPAQIREIRALIRELAGKHTILLSSHILPEVELSCDRILMIARGKIRAQGTIDELRRTAARNSRYVLETTANDLSPSLTMLEGVESVEHAPCDDAWHRYQITAARESGDLRESIAEAVSGMNGRIRELRREAPSLEHLFVQISAEAEVESSPQPSAVSDRRPTAVTSPPGHDH